MKQFFLTLLLCTAQLVNAQVYSYFFEVPVPPNWSETGVIEKQFYGTYTSDSDRKIIVNEAGIFTENTLVLKISRETVRESSQYKLKGDYLFGVMENDSVLCVLNDEHYYYQLTDLVAWWTPNKQDVLLQKGGEFYLNKFEYDAFTPMKLVFSRGELIVHPFDYVQETTVFNHIKQRKEQEEQDVLKVVLTPTKKEWGLINPTEMFAQPEVYKVKE